MNTTSGTDAERTMAPGEQARRNAEWTARMAEADLWWEAHRAREARLLDANKAALFLALAAAGVTRVVATFDGSGDSGQIEDISTFAAEGRQVDLPAAEVAFQVLEFDAVEPTTSRVPVAAALEHLAYGLLGQTHGGWENNDGAYGEFTFDVAGRSITLDYNERYTASEYHWHEF